MVMSIRERRHLLVWFSAGVMLFGSCAAQVRQPPTLSEAASPTPSASARDPASTDATLIIPGQSVGLLRLGDTRERTFELFPKKANYDEEYTYGEPCPRTEIHWLDIDPGKENETVSNGVFVYLKQGRVVQIESATPRYRTSEGITEDSSPEDVRRSYPELQAYALTGSGAEVVGGRDLIYWVEGPKGIAFELYYDHKTNKRRVRKIIVFEPARDFRPEGCVSPPQELRQLKPFTLEPPNGNARKSEQ
jgi:hypothetical protein